MMIKGNLMNLLKDNKDIYIFFDKPNIKNKEIDLERLTTGSRKIVFWKCEKGHSFERKMSEFKKSQSCPICRKEKSKNSVSENKQLINEWLFSKNKNIDPSLVGQGNNRLKAWWCCKNCKHEWKALIYSRAVKNSGCPKCSSRKQHSKNEMRIYAELKSLFKDVFNDYKVEGSSYDIYVKDINLLIEYDGFKWHKDRFKNDMKKNDIAEKNGFTLIRLREKGLSKINKDDILIPFDFNIRRDFKTQKSLINLLLINIEKHFDLKFEEYIKSDDFLNIDTYNIYENKIKHKKTVADDFLLDEWNYEKNNGILPKNVSFKTSTQYWWKCKKGDDHVWESSPSNRQIRKCPFCANKKVSVTNRFDLKEPLLLKLWNFDKNVIKPNELTNRNGTYKIFWNCGNCKKEIIKTVCSMVETKGFCSICKNYNN